MPARRAFTLVELLVVVGILVVLIALLMPALSRARASAQLLRCSTNLRSMAHAAQSYAADHKGRFPRDIPPGGVPVKLLNPFHLP